MIHVHVIITAVVLLVGAFAALIICMCVDIVPIIKSRASTLASRDSATQEQARKLKKSLHTKIKIKDAAKKYGRSEKCKPEMNTQNSNVYESNLQLSCVEDIAQTKTSAAKFASGSTPTTTTMVVSSVSTMEAKRESVHCFAAPEGDHSTQQTSAVSSLSQNSENNPQKAYRTDIEEVVLHRCSSPSLSYSSHVLVSVHNILKHPISTTSSIKSKLDVARDITPKDISEMKDILAIERVNAFQKPTSSNDYISQNSNDRFCESNEPLVAIKLKDHQNEKVSDRVQDRQINTDRTNCPALSQSKEYQNHMIERECSELQTSHRDYHDAPWDSSSRNSLIYRDQFQCKWCYTDHVQCKRHHHVNSPAVIPLSPTTPFLDLKKNSQAQQLDEETACSCPYHRKKSSTTKLKDSKRTSSNRAVQRYSPRAPTKQNERQSSPYCLTGDVYALHGNGSYHRSSSHSSSSSPSSLSSSPHSSKRRRKTKLEDIQEDAGWCIEKEMESKYCNEKVGEINMRLMYNNLSNQRSLSPDGVRCDDEQTCGYETTLKANISQYLGMKRGSRDLVLANDTKAAIEGLVTYSGT